MKKGIKVLLVLFWVIFFAVAALIYGYSYIVPRISGALTKTAVVNFGELKSEDKVNALIVRDEEVVYAKDSGELSYYSRETEKTRKDAKILDIYPSGEKGVGYYCAQTAFISYYFDGCERKYTPEKISELKAEDIAELSITPQDTARQSTEYGKPLYKYLNSEVWYIVFPVPQSRIGLYKPGNIVTVDFGDGEVTAKIDQIIGSGENLLVSVYTKKYYVNFAKIRTAEVTVITQDYEGLLVPNSSIIVDEEGHKGVFVENVNNEFDFKRIEVIVENEEESLCTADSFTEKDEDGNDVKISTIKIYDEILRNAQ